MVIQQNIDLAAELVLTPKGGLDFQLACKIIAVFFGFLLLRSTITGLSLSYNLFKEHKLSRAHELSVKVLSDYERNYYVVNQTEGAGQLAGGGDAERVRRVYYVLRSLAQYKLPGAKLNKIALSQGGMELVGVAENMDVALKQIGLLKEELSSKLRLKFDNSNVTYRDNGMGMVDFSLAAGQEAVGGAGANTARAKK